MKDQKPSRNKMIIATLFVLFSLPGLLASWFYKHPTLLSQAKVNKGQLLTPAELIADMPSTEKWRIVYWSGNSCGKICQSRLDVLARLRLALGRKLYHVDQVLLLNTNTPLQDNALTQFLQQRDFKTHILAADEPYFINKKPGIYLMDPNKYLVLSYSVLAKPKDIYNDLARLLNVNEAKRVQLNG